MSVVGSAGERPDRRTMTEDKEGHRSYRRVFLVKVNSEADDGNVVLTAPDLPRARDRYEIDGGVVDYDSFVVKRTPRQMRKTRLHWEVDIDYEYIPPERRERDPLMRAVKVGPFTYERQTVPVVGTLRSSGVTPASTDIYEEPYRNSLGDKYPVQPMMPSGHGVLEYTRNEDSFSPAWAMEWENVTNDDAWCGAEPEQLLMDGPPTCAGAERENVDGGTITYCPVVYRIQFKYEGHAVRMLDEGPDYRLTTASTADRTPFIDQQGHPYIGKLDGKGRPLACNVGLSTAAAAASTLSSTVTAVYRKHDHPRTKTFSSLGLPETFIPS